MEKLCKIEPYGWRRAYPFAGACGNFVLATLTSSAARGGVGPRATGREAYAGAAVNLAILLLALAPGLSAQILTPTAQAPLRRQIREALFVPDPLPPLDAQFHGMLRIDDNVEMERVSFGTEFGMRVPANLYLPSERDEKIPALIVVNGHGGSKSSWYAFYTGVLYAYAGAAVLTYDPAGEGERNPERKSGTRAHDKIERNPELGRRQGGLMQTDLMQAVSYLLQRDEVDPKRIAVMGYSMGSFVVSIAGAIDARIRAAVLVGGGNLDGPGGQWDSAKPMCQGYPYQALSFLGDRPAVLYALQAARGPTLIYNGLEDSVVHIPETGPPFFDDLRKRTVKLLATGDGVFDSGFSPGTSHRPYFVTRPVAAWLEDKLDFPNWTPRGIEDMPETHISEWAKEQEVEMDPLYATEHREGGTPALGNFVGGLWPEELNVYTDREWERNKKRLVIDEWVRQAKELIGNSEAPAGSPSN